MTRLRRRSWYQPRSQKSDVLRLYVMVALLVAVLLMAFFAQRSEIWSGLFPDEGHVDTAKTDFAKVHSPALDAANSQAKKSTPQTIELVPIEPPPKAKQPEDYGTRWMMGGLILVTIAYFGWRIYSITRRFSRRPALQADPRDGRRMFLPDDAAATQPPGPPPSNTDRGPTNV